MNSIQIAELVDSIIVAEMRFLFALERDDGRAAGQAIEDMNSMLRKLHNAIEQSGMDDAGLEEARAFYADLLNSFSAITHSGLSQLKKRDLILSTKVKDLDHSVTVISNGDTMVICHGKVSPKLRVHGRFDDGTENDFTFLCDPNRCSWVNVVQSAIPTYAEHGFVVEEIFGKVS